MTPTAVLEVSTSLLEQLANLAARSFILAGAAALGLVTLRVKAPSARLFAWTGVLYAALAMPLLGWILPPLSVPSPKLFRDAFPQVSSPAEEKSTPDFKAAPAAQPVAAAPAPSITIAAQRPIEKIQSAHGLASVEPKSHWSSSSVWSSIRWNIAATAIYFAGAFVLLARFFVGLMFSRRLMQSSPIIDRPLLTGKLAESASTSGLAFVPRAAESQLISVPVTMGVLRPIILLPGSWREWDDAKLDAVIAHEMSHVARRDGLTQRLSLLHRAIFWFSPLAWWLERHLADLAEQASDEAALSYGVDRKDYARTLLEFFEALQDAPGRVWWQGVSMAKSGQAEQRVERILAWKGAVPMKVEKSGFEKSEFEKSSFKKSALRKSIAVVAIAFAVPVVYLAASVRPAGTSVNSRLAQDQTPPPEPRIARAPEAPPNATPIPAPAPTSDATPPPEPVAQPEALPGPAASVSAVPTPRPASAPGAAAYPYPPFAPRSPIAPMQAMIPLSAWIGHSGTSGSSHGRGFSYSYGYDDQQRFVIVSGKTDALTMSGSMDDAHHVEKLRKTIAGDFIWFQRDEKSYIIRDQATADQVRKLWAPQEELGKKQEELGRQQEALGKQQEALGEKMEQVNVNVPDIFADLDKLKAELKELKSSATMDQLGHLQSEIGELQSKIGDLQSQAGEQQSKLGEEMGALGEKQGKLGEQQGELGRQQGELAQQASRKMKRLLDEAITKGTAQPEP